MLRLFGIDAHHYPVRTHEILHRAPFFQELGIGSHIETDIRIPFGQHFLYTRTDFLRRPHRDSAFGDHQHIVFHAFAYLAGNFHDIAKIRRTVLVLRSAYRYENYLGVFHRLGQLRSKRKAAFPHIPLYEFVKPGFIDRDVATRNTGYLCLIDIDASHGHTHFGKTASRNQTDISCSYNDYFHTGKSTVLYQNAKLKTVFNFPSIIPGCLDFCRYKSQNSFSPRDISSKTIVSRESLQFGISVEKSRLNADLSKAELAGRTAFVGNSPLRHGSMAQSSP